MATVDFSHQITYETKHNTSVSDVANSLLANEKLMRYAGIILQDCIEGFDLESVEIKVSRVTQNSPLEELLIGSLFITYQTDLVREVPLIIERFLGVKVSDKYKTVVSVLAMAIAIYGAGAVVKSLFPDKETANLDRDYKTLTYIAGDYISVSPHSIERSIENNFSGQAKQEVKRAGIDFFRPAKREGVGILGPMGLKISREAVQETPSEIDLVALDETEQYPLQDVSIEIRALDKDRKKHGWYAVIQDVTDKRLRMQIYPTVDLNRIIGDDSIRGDVIVVNKKNAEGVYEPSMYHLVNLR